LHLEAVLLVDLGHQLTCEFVRWHLLLHLIETPLESLTTCVLPEVALLRGHLSLGLCAFLSLLLAEVELFFSFALPTVSAPRELVSQSLLLSLLLFEHFLLKVCINGAHVSHEPCNSILITVLLRLLDLSLKLSSLVQVALDIDGDAIGS
jgi:hypothetical protein